MGQWVTRDEFGILFGTFEHTAFRLETQPYYTVDWEHESVARLAAGQPLPPTDVPEYLEWLDYVRSQVKAGRQIQRVRIQEDLPSNDYQRWERWAGRWNVEAGEQMRYLTPQRAAEIALPIEHDWWLFDSSRAFRMEFNDDIVLLGGYLITEPAEVIKHCAWRDLAVHYSAPDDGAATT